MLRRWWDPNSVPLRTWPHRTRQFDLTLVGRLLTPYDGSTRFVADWLFSRGL